AHIIPNYNIISITKAALKASIHYLTNDLDPNNIHINTLSTGPIRTLTNTNITNNQLIYNHQKTHTPLRHTITLNDINNSTLYLLSDLSSSV
ncbi:enoyl-[acyl-carrier-protein] reductase FabI, partial [Enterococcus hirae]